MLKKVLFISLTLLAGCDITLHPSERLLQDYLQRIATVQNQDPLPVASSDIVTIPDKRELIIDIPTTTLGLLDSYELRKCGLFELIAEKNSVLGKVQDSFRNYDYQIEVLNGLTLCLNDKDISEELKAALRDINNQKKPQLSAHFSNLLFTSDAMRSQLNGNAWLEPEIKVIDHQLKQAFLALTDNHNKSSASPVTQFQEVLDKRPTLGNLRLSLINATQYLQTINRQLNFYDSQIVCKPNRDKKQYTYLKNVFNNIYLIDVQPYLAQLDSLFLQIEPIAIALQKAHPEYQYPLVKEHKQFREATLAHVRYWQGLFERCGGGVSR